MARRPELAQAWRKHFPSTKVSPWVPAILVAMALCAVLPPLHWWAPAVAKLFGSATAASWAQAIGSVAAVAAAIWISTDQHRQNREADAAALRSDRYAAIALTIHASSLLRGLTIALRDENLFLEAATNYSSAILIIDRHIAALPPHLMRDRHGLEQYAQVPGLLLKATDWVSTLELNIRNIPGKEDQFITARMCADGLEGLAAAIERKAISLANLYGFIGVEAHIKAVGVNRYANPFGPVDAPDITHAIWRDQ